MSGRSRVDRLFEELEVECGTSVECILERASALLRLDIEVEVLNEEEWHAVPRFVLLDGDRARIPVRRADPQWFRLHVVIHELAHLLCGHARCEPAHDFRPASKARAGLCSGGSGRGAGSAAFADSPQEADQQADQEAEAEALAHRLGSFVVVPQFASAEVG